MSLDHRVFGEVVDATIVETSSTAAASSGSHGQERNTIQEATVVLSGLARAIGNAAPIVDSADGSTATATTGDDYSSLLPQQSSFRNRGALGEFNTTLTQIDENVSQSASCSGGAPSSSRNPPPVQQRSKLAIKADKFLRCVHSSDRRGHGGIKYRDVFVGCETIDSLLYRGVVSTRQEGIDLGRTLAKELRLFAPVYGGSHNDFRDEYFFYRIRNDVIADRPREKLPPAARRELGKKVELFAHVVEAKDRSHRLSKYKSVFVGSEAVDRLVYAGFADTRFEAVQLGRVIAKEFGLFEHVKNEHPFADAFLFYKYKASVASILNNKSYSWMDDESFLL